MGLVDNWTVVPFKIKGWHDEVSAHNPVETRKQQRKMNLSMIELMLCKEVGILYALEELS